MVENMRSLLGFLNVRYRHIVYDIKLFSKYTIITGFSGTGKSELLRLIEDALIEHMVFKNPEVYNIYVTSSAPLAKIDSWFNSTIRGVTVGWLDALRMTFKEHSIICIDETFLGLYDQDFLKAMEQFDTLFVIICRDSLKSLPYKCSDVYTLESLNGGSYHYNKLVCCDNSFDALG